MKKRCKMLLAVIAIISCFIIMSAQVLAAERLDEGQNEVAILGGDVVYQGTIGESVFWSIDSNYRLTIWGMGEMPDYYSWQETDRPWHDYSSLITAVDIRVGITTIGNRAFSDLSGITEITIPDGITKIGSYAFRGCSELTEVTIPDSVTSIGESAFSDCSGLTGITIPDSVTDIGALAFNKCSGLTEVTIPDSVVNIGIFAFSDCENIEKAVVGQKGLDALEFTDNLIEVELLSDVTTIDDWKFSECSRLTRITIPSSLTSIGEGAFCDCYKLTEAVIPDSVTSIGELAFRNCFNLTEIIVPGGVKNIGSNTFSGCRGLTKVTICNGVISIGKSAFSGCSGLIEIIIPDSVTSIGYGAFSGCSGLTEVTIPNSVTDIRSNAFAECSGLRSIVIPDGVTSIEPNVFSYCSGLTEVTIPDGITIINSYAFNNCSALKEIKIPDSVTIIGDSAFHGCSELREVIIPDSVKSIGNDSFDGCDNLRKAVILGNVTLGSWAFPSGCRIIYEKDLEAGTVNLSKDIFVYNGSAYSPDVTATTYMGVELEPGTDFTVSYKNNTNAGTATVTVTGIGNYSGTVTKTFTIEKKALVDTNVKVAYTETSYDGTAKKPVVTVSGLKEGTDFTVSYKNNTNAGTATVTVTGIGNYSGTVTKSFEIIKSAADNLLDGKSKLRIYGPNRYDTSVDTADALKKSLNISKFDNIIIADGRGYADALAGAYLAKVKNAPILVVGDDAASQKLIREYIASNLKTGGTVYILGGTGAVSEKFERSLNTAAYKVKRLGGKDRYKTNLMILSEAGVANEDILICSGLSFADSLSASAVGKPILLVGDKLNSEQITYLKTLSKRTYYIIGGTGAVSSTVERELEGYGPTQRVSGANRYSTSVEVANTFFGKDCTAAVLAYGLNFPDGLSGGPLAMSLEGPLILVTSTDITSAAGYVKNSAVNKLVTLGGPTLISDKAVENIIQ